MSSLINEKLFHAQQFLEEKNSSLSDAKQNLQIEKNEKERLRKLALQLHR
jgi:hypothetical protein